MLPKIGIFFLIIISSSYLFAQDFKGKVLDKETNQPLNQVNVYCLNYDINTKTNENGEFIIRNAPQKFNLKLHKDGYETFILEITEIQTEVEFKLTPLHFKLDEVIVSTAFGKLQSENIMNVTSIKLTELNSIPSTTLGQSISMIPGVYTSSQGTGISKPVIRGLSGNRVVSYIDGLRIENQQWGDDHGMGITEMGIERVEIIKGPSSLLYGSDALGGVIYFVEQNYAPQNTWEAYYQSRLESNTLGTNNQFGYKVSRNKMKFNVYGTLTSHADYMMGNGFRAKDSRFSEKNVKASFGYNKENWLINIRYSFINNIVGIPGHTHADSIYPELFFGTEIDWFRKLPHQDINNHYLWVENKFFLKKGELNLLVGNTNNRLREFEDKVTIPGIDLNLNNTNYNFKYKSKIGKNLYYTIGTQGMYQINLNGKEALERLIPDAKTIDFGTYGLIYYTLNKWKFQAGARFDIRQIETFEATNDIEIFKKSYNGLNYSSGFIRNGLKSTIRMNVSSGFRAPHPSELLQNGVHHGALNYTVGNRNLVTEQSLQIDASLELHGEHFEFIINPYYNLIQNFVYLSPTDSVIEGYPVFEYSQNPLVNMYGADVGIHFHPHGAHWLHLESSFSYLRAEDSQKNPIPFIPQTRINSQIKFDFKKKEKFYIQNIVIQNQYFFAQNRNGLNELPTQSYNLLNMGINSVLPTKSNSIHFNAGVRNLLNQTYFDHLARIKNIGLFMPGINFYLGAKMNFGGDFKTHKIENRKSM